MNKRILAIIGLVILGALLFGAGAVYGQFRWTPWDAGDWYRMMGAGMMGNRARSQQPFGPGLMGGNGMMGNGMMDGMGMRSGMGIHRGMSNWWNNTGVEPLSVEEAETAVRDYLATLGQDDLSLGEVMIFSNHAYAQIVYDDSGTGAFEVLVDPVTGNVFPEPGPNMMWNTEYGDMGGFGRGMMGSWSNSPEAEAGVTAAEAVQIAQRYLDPNLPGTTADETADAFPGYYTLHVLQDGDIIGMLSVNATTGQVFPHHWHGDFIEMAGEDS